MRIKLSKEEQKLLENFSHNLNEHFKWAIKNPANKETVHDLIVLIYCFKIQKQVLKNTLVST